MTAFLVLLATTALVIALGVLTFSVFFVPPSDNSRLESRANVGADDLATEMNTLQQLLTSTSDPLSPVNDAVFDDAHVSWRAKILFFHHIVQGADQSVEMSKASQAMIDA